MPTRAGNNNKMKTQNTETAEERIVKLRDDCLNYLDEKMRAVNSLGNLRENLTQKQVLEFDALLEKIGHMINKAVVRKYREGKLKMEMEGLI